MNIIQGLPPIPPYNSYVALDTEIFQMNKTTLHRPTSGKFACMTACLEPETVYMIQDENDVPKLLNIVKDCIWVIHNAKWHYRDWETDRKSTRLNSSHSAKSRMPSSA